MAGLPKSGTSWVESMLASFRGYQEIMLPRVIFHEVRHGGSHDYTLSDEDFGHLQDGLHVLKLHTRGSRENSRVLQRQGVRYVIVYRDLRDVAVSHYFYVRRTPWHPEHRRYRELSVDQGIDYFADTLLEPFAEWITGWHRNADRELAHFVRYEDLLDDALGELSILVRHFGIGADRRRIEEIQQDHSFSRVSGGRSRGESDDDSFVRKGVSGDWKNWFSEKQERRYRDLAGEALDAGGYL